jgi:hypothetical protein
MADKECNTELTLRLRDVLQSPALLMLRDPLHVHAIYITPITQEHSPLPDNLLIMAERAIAEPVLTRDATVDYEGPVVIKEGTDEAKEGFEPLCGGPVEGCRIPTYRFVPDESRNLDLTRFIIYRDDGGPLPPMRVVIKGLHDHNDRHCNVKE